jgi:hypothetical protein
MSLAFLEVSIAISVVFLNSRETLHLFQCAAFKAQSISCTIPTSVSKVSFTVVVSLFWYLLLSVLS